MLNAQRLSEPFEFVVVEARLASPADPLAFAEYLATAELVAVFPNLGNNAVLVSPTDLDDGADRRYLASFLRTAPEGQVDEFWRALGEAIEARVGRKPVWVSTSGGGVPWLHARLDDRPKYYTYGPYRG